MTTAILLAAAAICGFGWLVTWVGNAAMAKCLQDKGHTPPTDEEMTACSVYVWKRLLRIK